MTELILPSQTKRQKQESTSKQFATGISPWERTIHEQNIIPKIGKWKQCYGMYQHHSIVRAAIDKIAKTATNVGFDFVPRDSRNKIRAGELDKLQKFFNKQQDFIYELRRIYKDLLIYGDAFMYIVPNKMRQPHALKRLPPQTIAVRADEHGVILGYVQFNPNDLTNTNYVTFEPHEIMHFRIDDPDNDLYGLSPLISLEWAVAADIYAQQYNAAFFENSGVSGTIIAVKGSDPNEFQRNRQYMMENYIGPRAAHRPLFLEGDNVSVAKSVATHTEMGFLEGRQFIILEILAVLDVPPAKIGIMESANRSNSKEQDKSFRSESVDPLQYIVESVINGQFIRPILGVENTMFVHSEGDTRDAVELMDYYTSGIAWGVFNVNEVRAKHGLPNVEGGDINGIMAPTGFVPLDRMNLFFRPPKTNIDEVPEVPEDPIAGEPLPEATADVGTGISRDVSKAFSNDELQEKYDAAREGLRAILKRDGITYVDVVKAYSYLNDALGVEPAFDKIHGLLKRMKNEQDEALFTGYFERIKETFYEWVEQREESYG